MKTITLRVNGRTYTSETHPERSLLQALQHDVGVNPVRTACKNGRCSGCTVHVDDLPQRACQCALSDVAGKQIVTLEGLAASEDLPANQLHAVQKAWIEEGVPACACQSGLIMATAALLMQNAAPTPGDIEQAIHLDCGCGVRPHVYRVIRSLAER